MVSNFSTLRRFDGRATALIRRDIENLQAAAARHGATSLFIGCVNYQGPHHKDVAPAAILPIVLRPKPLCLLFEAFNPCVPRARGDRSRIWGCWP